MAARLKYDTVTCGRCGGSGHYSYCSMYGTRCFGCAGRKTKVSKAGAKASAAVKAFIAEHFSVKIEDLVVGDRISYDGKAHTIAAIERYPRGFGSADPVTKEMVWRDGITLRFTKSYRTALGPCDSVGMGEGAVLTKAVAGADWDRVVAFARTLKKGVTIVESAPA